MADFIWADRDAAASYLGYGTRGYMAFRFEKKYARRAPAEIIVRFFSPSRCVLRLDGETVAAGIIPVSPLPAPGGVGYYREMRLAPRGCEFLLSADVFSGTGEPGDPRGSESCFWLTLLDTAGNVLGGTDRSWSCRPLPSLIDDLTADYRIPQTRVSKCAVVPAAVTLRRSPLPLPGIKKFAPASGIPMTVAPGSASELELPFNGVMAVLPTVALECSGECGIDIIPRLPGGEGPALAVAFSASGSHTASRPFMCTGLRVILRNMSDAPAAMTLLSVSAIIPPDTSPALFSSSGRAAEIYSSAAALAGALRLERFCDIADGAPVLPHCVYAQIMSGIYGFSDTSLPAAELFLWGERLAASSGGHEPCSMLFPRALYAYFMRTGDAELVRKMLPALDAVVSCGISLISDGLLPPSGTLSSCEMSCLFVMAADSTARLCAMTGEQERAERCVSVCAGISERINAGLLDVKSGAYRDDAGAPSLPATSFAVLARVAPAASRAALSALSSARAVSALPPLGLALYSEALVGTGLFEKHGAAALSALSAAEPSARVAIVYILRLAVSGLSVLSPGMARVSLSPRLLLLDTLQAELPTPHGAIKLVMQTGEKTRVTVPRGITVVR